jgi:hypothetical protein
VEKIGKTWVEQELGAPETESPAMPKRRRRRRSIILQPPAMIFAISNLQKESCNAAPATFSQEKKEGGRAGSLRKRSMRRILVIIFRSNLCGSFLKP